MEFRFIMYNYHSTRSLQYFFLSLTVETLRLKHLWNQKGKKGFMIASIFILPPSLLNTRNEQYFKKVFGLSENVIDFSTLL